MNRSVLATTVVLTYVIRIATTFLILGEFSSLLNINEFGLLIYGILVAQLIGVASDFGYQNILLNYVKSRDKRYLRVAIKESLSLKIYLTIILAIPIILLISFDVNRWFYAGLFFAITNSFLEFIFYYCRVIQKNNYEFFNVFSISLLSLIVIYLFEFLSSYSILLIVLVVRLVAFAFLCKNILGFPLVKIKRAKKYFESKLKYALESYVSAIQLWLDFLWLSLHMPSLIPIYQPYNRVFTATLGFFPYTLPYIYPRHELRISKRSRIVFFTISLFASLSFYFVSSFLVSYLYPNLPFIGSEILKLLSFIIFVKYNMALDLSYLTRINRQNIRFWLVLLGILASLVLINFAVTFTSYLIYLLLVAFFQWIAIIIIKFYIQKNEVLV